MAIEVVIETRIDEPVDAVFDHVAALDRWPEWLIASGIVEVDRSVDGPAQSGERLRIRQNAAGRSGTFDVTVVALERPARLSLGGRDEAGVSIDIDAELTPVDGQTDLRWSIRIGLPMRYRILESMATPQVQRAAALDLEALKRRAEAGDDG
jgi:uncharacterized protein YndB with AHSA1/START domain